MSWANEEFEEVNLGDKRLTARLVKLCNKFSEIYKYNIIYQLRRDSMAKNNNKNAKNMGLK